MLTRWRSRVYHVLLVEKSSTFITYSVIFYLLIPLSAKVVPHSQGKSAGLSLKMQVRVRSKRKTKVTDFHGKRDIAKITRSTIYKVQLKSGENCINKFDVSRF
jgi:hypothetical protein